MIDNNELSVTVEAMTELISLIQRYPSETRRILAAVDDGLTLGPARPMSGEAERCRPAGQTGVGEAVADQ